MVKLGYAYVYDCGVNELVDAASEAKELGFDFFTLGDGPIMPDGGKMKVDYDPIPALGVLAATTTDIQLATTVLLAAHREPITTAKALATIQKMSGGRLILGVGTGWRAEEIKAFGLEGVNRGKRLEHVLDLYDAWFRGDPSFTGPAGSWSDTTPVPQIAQPPELWMGGLAEPVRLRALRRGAVWHPPFKGEVHDAEFETRVRDFLAQGGKGFAPHVNVSMAEVGSPAFLRGRDRVVEGLTWLHAMGMTHCRLAFDSKDSLKWFFAEAHPLLVEAGVRN